MGPSKPVVVLTGAIDILSTWILQFLEESQKFTVRCSVSSYCDIRAQLLKKRNPHIKFWQCSHESPGGWEDILDGANYLVHTVELEGTGETITEREQHILKAAVKHKVERVLFLFEGCRFQEWSWDEIDKHVFTGKDDTLITEPLCDELKDTETTFAVLSIGVCFGEMKLAQSVGAGSAIIRHLTEQPYTLPLKNSCSDVRDAAELAVKMLTDETCSGEHILFGQPIWIKDMGDIIYTVGKEKTDGLLKAATRQLPAWGVHLYNRIYSTDIASTQNFIGADFEIENSRAEEILGRRMRDVRSSIAEMTSQMIDLGCLVDTVQPSKLEEFYLMEKKRPARHLSEIITSSTVRLLQDKTFTVEQGLQEVSFLLTLQSMMLFLGYLPYFMISESLDTEFMDVIEDSPSLLSLLIAVALTIYIHTFVNNPKRLHNVGSNFSFYIALAILLLYKYYESNGLSFENAFSRDFPLLVCILCIPLVLFIASEKHTSIASVIVLFWGSFSATQLSRAMMFLFGYLLNCPQSPSVNGFPALCLTVLISITIPTLYSLFATRNIHTRFAPIILLLCIAPFFMSIPPLQSPCDASVQWTGQQQPTENKWLQNEFQKWDTDKSGNLDLCEFRFGMNEYNINNEVLRLAFTFAVQREDVRMDYAWTDALKCLDFYSINLNFMMKEFTTFDTDRNKRLSLEEFQEYLSALKIEKEILEDAFFQQPEEIKFNS